MHKVTLEFSSLSAIASYAQLLNTGYVLNTCNLTITGKIPPREVELAIREYAARQVVTNEKIFSYSMQKQVAGADRPF